ncbi:plasmid replication protein, CyRepA1 family [Planktothrix pseudagardhii]|uniref:DNA primase n=1 Tax=Planktothrix pseudagardhii TaxID=132604 RepID=A0A9W4CRE5_9CYAN|nr:plasmid replication protein, CyRepA1 family [Planktothrix pseudagardhii]CAD5977047.1 DNA primase [Planktothrix pseudagardhii]
MTDSERHIEHTKLIDQLSLNFEDNNDLKRRGLTDEQIKKEPFRSVKQWQKLKEYVNPNLAGVNVSGKGSTNFHDGLLCFTKNPKGEITGYQIRVTDKGSNSRYVWATSKANDNRGIDATVHLKETGELPLTCEFINPEDKDLKLCEGILKPKVAAYRHNQNYLGASGGNFTASPETFASYVNAFSPERIILCPDKGSLNNPQVLNNWRKTRDFLVNLGYDVYVEIWENADNYDVDEYPEGSLTKIVSYTEWDTDYKITADISSGNNEKFNEWLSQKGFTPNITINQQYLTNPLLELPWKDGDTYFIKSGLGTAKTTWLIDRLKCLSQRKFALGKINNLLFQFIAKTDGDFCHYQEHDGRLLRKDVHTNFALCINSLIHFDPEDFDDSIIIIDEVMSVLKQLYSPFLGSRRNAVIRLFEEAIRRAAIVFCLDGTLANNAVEFIKELRGKDKKYYSVLNEHKSNPFNITILQTTDTNSGKILMNEMSGVFKRILSHDKPVFVTATSQKNCETLDRMATGKGKKVIRLDSTTSPDECMKRFLSNPSEYIELEKPDLVIISPSGGEGLDISIKGYFEAGYHIGNFLDADANFQMIARLRDPSVPRYLWVSHKSFIVDNKDTESWRDIMLDSFHNLRDDLGTLSCDDAVKAYQEMVVDYIESPHSRLEPKLNWISEFETNHLRDCLILMLQKAGHKVKFGEINNCKETKQEIKETKEAIIQEEITEIFNSEDIPDTVGKRWENNSQGLTKEQRCQLKKWKYKRILPGIADTQHWNILLIEMLVKKPQILSALTLGHFLNNPDKARLNTEQRLLKLLEKEDIVYLDSKPSYYQKVNFLREIRFVELITKDSGLINPDDELINFIHQECKKPKARRLGFSSSGNDKVKTINKLLKAIGLSWERKQLRDKGDVLTRYQVLPLSDLEQALTDAIERRINERITEATKQVNGENEYPDFASERVDIDEPTEPTESVTDVSDYFYKEESKTSVTATPPTGSKIELSLPIDFYFKNSLVFDRVNGKSWEIVEYVQIHGNHYVDLKGKSGDKATIPLDWILYCCDCIQ